MPPKKATTLSARPPPENWFRQAVQSPESSRKAKKIEVELRRPCHGSHVAEKYRQQILSVRADRDTRVNEDRQRACDEKSPEPDHGPLPHSSHLCARGSQIA